jgi:hypothetical protein
LLKNRVPAAVYGFGGIFFLGETPLGTLSVKSRKNVSTWAGFAAQFAS